jgi:hypothetical protein
VLHYGVERRSPKFLSGDRDNSLERRRLTGGPVSSGILRSCDEVFISPHYFYPADKGWKFRPLETDEATAGLFARKGVFLGRMLANMCVESHLRELLEQGFRGRRRVCILRQYRTCPSVSSLFAQSTLGFANYLDFADDGREAAWRSLSRWCVSVP